MWESSRRSGQTSFRGLNQTTMSCSVRDRMTSAKPRRHGRFRGISWVSWTLRNRPANATVAGSWQLWRWLWRSGWRQRPPSGRLEDPDNYLRLARRLAEGRGFAWNGRPTAYRPPLYPLLLVPLVAALADGKPLGLGIAVLHAALGAATVAAHGLGRAPLGARTGPGPASPRRLSRSTRSWSRRAGW